MFSIEEGMCHAETTWTHFWIYDLETQTLTPFLETNRRAPYMMFVAEMPNHKRVVVALNTEGENRHVMMSSDGTGEEQEIKHPDDGFSYCLSLSPDGTRWLFHTASRRGGYRVSVMDFDGGGMTEIAGHPDRLYFAPYWSPDGEWIVSIAFTRRISPTTGPISWSAGPTGPRRKISLDTVVSGSPPSTGDRRRKGVDQTHVGGSLTGRGSPTSCCSRIRGRRGS